MAAYLVLLIAVLSRFVPHALHGVGLNFTAVGGGLLFFGSRRRPREALFAAAAFALSDLYLTTVVFAYPFHLSDYAVTWLWYLAVPLLGRALLAAAPEDQRPTGMADNSPARFPAHVSNRPTPAARTPALARAAGAILGSAGSFFLLSNGVVWVRSTMYPHTGAGLLACYTAGLPFLGNDLVSTGLTVGVLFGLPALARELHRVRSSPPELPLG